MADETPIKLLQIGPKGGAKKDGFNLVTEKVVSVNPAAKQLEVELLAYDGKTVVLDVAEEALEDLQKIKPGDGATIRVVEEGGKRLAKSFRIRAKDPNAVKADAMLVRLEGYALAQSQICGGGAGGSQRYPRGRAVGRVTDG